MSIPTANNRKTTFAQAVGFVKEKIGNEKDKRNDFGAHGVDGRVGGEYAADHQLAGADERSHGAETVSRYDGEIE